MAASDLLFAKTHEWVRVDRSGPQPIGTVGVSAFAVESLTDLVFIELPSIGRKLKAGESFGEIESVKAVSDLYSPASGEIIEVNSSLANHLETLNKDPYGAGWMIKIRLSDPEELKSLLDEAAYRRQCQEEAH